MTTYKTAYGEFFDKAFNELMSVESVKLTNDPDDPGAMTCCGISRVYNSSWEGWKLIDEGLNNKTIKINKDVPASLVETYVADLYYEKYWKPYGCDDISGELACEIFDQAVNPGSSVMTKNLQECLNTLNYDTKTKNKKYTDLEVDGKFGKKTKERLIEFSKSYSKFLIKAMNAKQGSYYLSLASGSVSKRKYVKGWILNRI